MNGKRVKLATNPKKMCEERNTMVGQCEEKKVAIYTRYEETK